MKVLQICKKFPYPLHDGESIAVNNLASSLHDQGCKMILLSMNTSKHYYDVSTIPKKLLQYYDNVITVEIDNKISKWGALQNIFTTKSYHVSRFESASFVQILKDILEDEKFDIILLETIQLATYIPLLRQLSLAKIVIRSHNVEHIIWKQVADNQSSIFNKWYLNLQVKRLKTFELKSMNECDLLMTISQYDLDTFQSLGFSKKGIVVPVGLDLNTYPHENLNVHNLQKMGFIGSLDWIPNQEGLKWFMNTIWKELLLSFPKLQLEIAGRTAPDWIKNISVPNTNYVGAPENAVTFINRNPIMLVPILQGSGIRIKILEGMALGRIIITTSAGLEGIPATNYSQIIIADNLNEFIKAIHFCITYPEKAIEIGNSAREFIEKDYNRDIIGKNVFLVFSI